MFAMVSVEGSLRWWDEDGAHHYKGQVKFKCWKGCCIITTTDPSLNRIAFESPSSQWIVRQDKVKSAHSRARVVSISFANNKRIQFTASISDRSDHGHVFYAAVLRAKGFY